MLHAGGCLQVVFGGAIMNRARWIEVGIVVGFFALALADAVLCRWFVSWIQIGR